MYTADDPVFEAIWEASGGNIGFVRNVLEALANLKASDTVDFKASLQLAVDFNVHAEWAAATKADTERQEIRRAKDNYRDKRVHAWVLKNVEPGMIVKVTGTRDKGYRQVIMIDLTRLDCGAPWYIECRQLEVSVPVGCRRPKYPKFDQLTDKPYITNHLLKKVTAVLIDDEWKNVVDLIREEEND